MATIYFYIYTINILHIYAERKREGERMIITKLPIPFQERTGRKKMKKCGKIIKKEMMKKLQRNGEIRKKWRRNYEEMMKILHRKDTEIRNKWRRNHKEMIKKLQRREMN